MSEEEKKAIDNFKKLDFFEYDWQFRDDDFETREDMLSYAEKMQEIILNIVNKQQKEIEEKNVAINKMSKDISRQLKEIEKLNFENHMLKKWNKKLDKDCISKDKIIEKIEHYNNELEHIKNGEEFENEKPMYYWGKVALEDLLEEDNDGDHIPRID